VREVEVVVLRLLQDEFPLCPRPFLELACRANRGLCRPQTVYFEVIGPGPRRRPVVARHKVKPLSERDVLSATTSLIRSGRVRALGAVFGPVEPAPGSLNSRVAEALRAGLPVVPEPYREVARRLDLTEEELIERVRVLRQSGVLRRFGAVLGPPERQSLPR